MLIDRLILEDEEESEEWNFDFMELSNVIKNFPFIFPFFKIECFMINVFFYQMIIGIRRSSFSNWILKSMQDGIPTSSDLTSVGIVINWFLGLKCN